MKGFRIPRGALSWIAVISVLVALVVAGAVTNTTLRSIEKNLPSTILEQLHDLTRIVEDISQVASAAELARAVPSEENLARLRKKAADVQNAVVELRNTYVFDNLVQASSFHAVVAPAIGDVQLWLSEGVSGHGPGTGITMDVVLGRVTDTFRKARELNRTSESMAQGMLAAQRDRLERFLFRFNVFFMVALLVMLCMMFLLVRQRMLERRELEARTQRKRMEEALHRSEERFRLLFNTINDAVFVHGFTPEGLPGRFLEVNDAACQRLGYTRDELLRMSPADIDASGSLELARRMVQKAMSEKRAVWEGTHISRDGERLPVEINIRLFDFGGEAAVISTVRDITARKAAEDALRKSEERFRHLFENHKSVMLLIEPDSGAIVDANPAAAAFYGYSREELRAMNIAEINQLPPEEIAAERRCALLEERDCFVFPHRLRSGEVRTVEVRSSPIELNDQVLLFSFVHDITERMKVEEALRESQERFRELAELLPETIFETDITGRLTFVNKNAFEFFGFAQEDLEGGLNAFDMICPEDRQRALDNGKRVLKGERLGLQEYRAFRMDGSTFPIITHSTAIVRDGRPVGLRGIVIDVTETKNLEAQLFQAHKMEAVGTLAGGIAHDFNNLLQAIQGYTELLLLDKLEDEPGYKDLQQIRHAAGRGAELTRQLLTFSRKVETRLQSVDLNRIVEAVRVLLERTIPKMIRIELRLTRNLHRVNADPSQIEQVLVNLALNARDAMPQGGDLVITTGNVVFGGVSHRAQPEVNPGEYVLLAVADTGQGMEEATLEHIFDPFFTTKEVGKGTGLGLAMVYGIVKSHRGHIRCFSNPGEGTTFEILLPAMQQMDETSGDMSGAAEFCGGDETVLLVDDEDSVRELGNDILTRFGYKVLTAEDAETALKIYQEKKNAIRLVILDLVMPGMGGAQCLVRLLELDSQARVIIASGHSTLETPETLMEMGARAYLTKPYKVEELLRLTRDVLDA